MAKKRQLRTLQIDVDKDIYQVNGRDFSKGGFYLALTFENGEWSLIISEDTIYTTSDH